MASLLGGMALTNSSTTAVHALAYPLGGMFGLAHGVANAVMLRHVMAFNAETAPERFAAVADCFGIHIADSNIRDAADHVVAAIAGLVEDVEIPRSLKEFGIQASDVPELAKAASQVTRLLDQNPRKLSLSDIETLYNSALG